MLGVPHHEVPSLLDAQLLQKKAQEGLHLRTVGTCESSAATVAIDDTRSQPDDRPTTVRMGEGDRPGLGNRRQNLLLQQGDGSIAVADTDGSRLGAGDRSSQRSDILLQPWGGSIPVVTTNAGRMGTGDRPSQREHLLLQLDHETGAMGITGGDGNGERAAGRTTGGSGGSRRTS